MSDEPFIKVRSECLRPAVYWKRPTGAEIQEVVRLAGFTGRLAADYLDLADKSGRQIRKWISEEARIPYATWALLCYAAGLGNIWEIDVDELRQARKEHPDE
ncbi:XRE family transcriptional regulator [Paraburkholderia heleia]|uniref:XRE family transcriptional regulator n=1 Tax=Paraburkholderia heleia TaxID=634127 RepID=UPI002AB66077|nr:XRE family transcriptional regulator [Paraburkholderia heleia]